jgi:hypothetical protein
MGSADMAINSFHGNGELVWTGSQAGAYSVEWAARLDGPWTNSWKGLASQALAGGGAVTNAVPMFYRVRGVPSTLLIHGDGAEGSTAITDEYAHVVSVNGNAQIATATQRYGSGSISFDGSGDSLSIPSSSDWAFGSDDFTVALWVNHSAAPVGHLIGSHQWGLWADWVIGWTTADIGVLFNGAKIVSATNQPTLGQWHHVALTRKQSAVYLFVDGSLVSTGSSAGVIANSFPLSIGAPANGVEFFSGKLDEIMIRKGVALWTTNFTPPSAAFEF